MNLGAFILWIAVGVVAIIVADELWSRWQEGDRIALVIPANDPARRNR